MLKEIQTPIDDYELFNYLQKIVYNLIIKN